MLNEISKVINYIRSHNIEASIFSVSYILCTCEDQYGKLHNDIIKGDFEAARKYLGY